jgi:hypothetical protein
MLDDDSITQALGELVSHLTAGNLDQAEATLEVLDFERLLHPLKDRSKGSRQFFDPAEPFGTERVHQTGDHIRSCSVAINQHDHKRALDEAVAAAARWSISNTNEA